MANKADEYEDQLIENMPEYVTWIDGSLYKVVNLCTTDAAYDSYTLVHTETGKRVKRLKSECVLYSGCLLSVGDEDCSFCGDCLPY